MAKLQVPTNNKDNTQDEINTSNEQTLDPNSFKLNFHLSQIMTKKKKPKKLKIQIPLPI